MRGNQRSRPVAKETVSGGPGFALPPRRGRGREGNWGSWVKAVRVGDGGVSFWEAERAALLQGVQPGGKIGRGHGGIVEKHHHRMQRRTILCRAHRHFGARAHNLHPQRARPPVQLFDPHEGAHRLGFRQNPLGDPLGQRFQKVQPFRGEFRRDGFGDAVIRQDAVDIILQALPTYVAVTSIGPPVLMDVGSQGSIITVEISVTASMKE